MDDFNEFHSENEENDIIKMPDSRMKGRSDRPVGKKRWLIPLALLLLIIVAISIFWFVGSRQQTGLYRWLMGRFTPDEPEIKITLPAVLFAGGDIDEIIAETVKEKGVNEINWIDDDMLIYTMSPEAKEILREEAAKNLEEKITAIKEGLQYPYVLSVSHDSSFSEFYLVAKKEQRENTLTAAAELLVLAAYYRHLDDPGDNIPEVSIAIEASDSGGAPEMMFYPADLDQAAALLENPPEPSPEPETPAGGDKVIVATGPDNLNLRSGPEITYLIIDILGSGTILEVIGTEGDWLEVITPEGKEGWVHGNYVELFTD
ncbi:MAG: SH3 domain-containing protein [Bacillota bacterium]|nr:SH3 domain-containing protein [Bacillota bacterium]